MVPAGNKAKRLSWVNHTTKTIQFRRYFHCYCIEFYECFTFESKAFPNCFKISAAKEITRCSTSISISQVVASIFVKENLMTAIFNIVASYIVQNSGCFYFNSLQYRVSSLLFFSYVYTKWYILIQVLLHIGQTILRVIVCFTQCPFPCF